MKQRTAPVVSLASTILAFSVFAAAAGTNAPPAESVLAGARAVAAAEHKAVFVHFSASWCKWCKRLEAFLHDEHVEPILSRYFVFVRLVVRERDPNKGLDHPGGMEVLARLGGDERGIPFTAVLDAEGRMTANSLMKVDDPQALNGMENLGYPGDPESIAHFLGMLQTAAPGLTTEERKVLEDWLVAHQPK